MEMLKSSVKLTQFSHGAGCGCKIAPAVLDKILHSTIAPMPDAARSTRRIGIPAMPVAERFTRRIGIEVGAVVPHGVTVK